MADPLSISASIAGLVALADLVFRATTDYVKSVKSSQKEVNDLYRELKNLSCVLHNLSLVAFELEVNAETQASSNQPASSLKPHHLHECQQLLRQLEEKLRDQKSHLNSGSGFERFRSRLKWPFTAAETKEMLQTMRRQKETIDTAIAADTLSKLLLCLSRQEESSARVEKLQLTATRILDMQLESFHETQKRGILDFFSELDYRIEFETNMALRHPMTGLWLTEGQDFAEWHATLGSKIWFTGIPGAGKSVLAALIIQECMQRAQTSPGIAVAFHFSVYRNQETHSPGAVLSSLCVQLAIQDANAFKELEEYHAELNARKDRPRWPSTEGLIAVLGRMCLCFNRVYIIVDGVDECGEHAEATAKGLTDLTASPAEDVISLAVLSRDEIAIRHILDLNCHNVEIAAHTEDLQEYVATELDRRISSRKLRLKDLRLKDEIMTHLVKEAQGMFRWVACQMDHLCDLPTDRSRREALLKLPPTLPATYERILLRIERYNEQVKLIVRRALLLIGSPRQRRNRRLSFREICELASIDENSESLYEDEIVEEEDILRWCGSLVRTSKGRSVIEFAHFTVQEYLWNDCAKHDVLRAYSISDETIGAVGGSLCIRYLMLQNHEQPVEATDDYINIVLKRAKERPLYEHAALEWPVYADFYGQSGKLGCSMLENLFQLPKTTSFCSWAIEIIKHCVMPRIHYGRVDEQSFGKDNDTARRVIESVLRMNFTPLHMAAALGMPYLCQHLLEQGANVSLRSEFGTPLQCAAASITAFADENDPERMTLRIRATFDSRYKWEPAREQTVQLLMNAGAVPNSRHVSPFRTFTLLGSAVSSPLSYGEGLDVAVDLLRGGVLVEEGDILAFKSRYNSTQGPRWLRCRGKAVVRLLEAVHHQQGSSSARMSLYALTLEFANRMWLHVDFSSPTSQLQLDDGHSEEVSKKHLLCIVNSNDRAGLERFLQSGRADLIRDVGLDAERPSWTSLHLAVSSRALEVIGTLLEAGVNPNFASDDGATPTHLCCHDEYEPALRLLLMHGASTTMVDEEGRTIWHRSAMFDSLRILRMLVELEGRDLALQSVSVDGDTPIAAALRRGHEDSVRFLLPYCSSDRSWKCGESLYRAAARVGDPFIIQGMMEAQVQRDGADIVTGNPLHYLRTSSSVECIKLLKRDFSIDQRREQDSLTPLESMLVRAVRPDDDDDDEEEMISDGAIAELLPSNAIKNPSEASKLWPVICERTIWQAMLGKNARFWFNKVVKELVALGFPVLYETHHQNSAVLPLIATVADNFQENHKLLLQRFRDDRTSAAKNFEKACNLEKTWNFVSPRFCWDDYDHLSMKGAEAVISGWPVEKWRCFSACFQQLAQNTRHWGAVVEHPSMVRLLSLSIFQSDRRMTSFLLENGVNIHARTDAISPFDFACFPEVHVSAEDFDHLLSFVTKDELERGIEPLDGCGPLHFIAESGTQGTQGENSAMRLRKLLQTGIDCNRPLSLEDGSPLTHHIAKRSLKTVEILLQHGADPRVVGPECMTPVLMATRMGDVSSLQMIAAASEGKDDSIWNHAWLREVSFDCTIGGNALHLAALSGQIDSISFYLERKLFSDLEAGRNDLGTPLYHAAFAGHHEAVKFLQDEGADVNAKDKDGQSPLHIAVSRGHLETVEVLLRLGATQQADIDARTPTDYALRSGRETILEALLQSFKDSGRLEVSVTSPRTLPKLADSFARAIRWDDVDRCSQIHAAGCPVDIELNTHRNLTPLIMAISQNKSLEVARWLLDAGASVSPTMDAPYGGQYFSAPDAAAGNAKFNSILFELVTKYLKEGGDILGVSGTPLHVAVCAENTEGVSILLDAIEKLHGGPETPGRAGDASWFPSLEAFVNHHGGKKQTVTALHEAATKKNIGIARMLVEAGANIDSLDEEQETPLHYAASSGCLDTVAYLISCGAKVDAVNTRGDTPLAIACQEGNWQAATLLLESSRGNTFVEGNILHLTAFAELNDAKHFVPFFRLLLDRGADMHILNANGISPAHVVLVSQDAVYLRSWINRDITALQLHRLTPWPSALFRDCGKYYSIRLLLLSKNLQILRRIMTREGVNRLLACDNPGSHSLLCWTVCNGEIGAIQPFVKLSPDLLEHRCQEHGTPMQAALSLERDETVKRLVRLGAQIPYNLLERIPLSSDAIHDQPTCILNWLLVGRHGERARIGYDTSNHAQEVKSYGGPAIAEVSLRWEWRQSRQESMWQYACRRSWILRGLRGKIVRPVRIKRGEEIMQTV